MVKIIIPTIRSITDVPDEELKQAVVDMCNRLHIHGSGDGYNLYDAIIQEKRKAITEKRQTDNVVKSAG